MQSLQSLRLQPGSCSRVLWIVCKYCSKKCHILFLESDQEAHHRARVMTVYLHFICIFLTYTFEQLAFIYFSGFLTEGYAAAHTLFRQVSVLELPLLRKAMLQIPRLAIARVLSQQNPHLDPPCTPLLPLPGCLGLSLAAGLQTELALWQGWPHPTPHSCRGKLCAPRSKQQLSGEFICSHMNSKSAFSISKLQKGFALWEMPKREVCVSLLGTRYKMHNASNKDMSETA